MSSKRTRESALLEYLGHLHRAVHAIGHFVESRFDGQVTQPEALVLLHLQDSGSSTIGDVHRAFLHRRSTLTSVLDRLENKGFISRQTGAGDRRSIDVALTRSGKRIAEKIASELEETFGSIAARRSIEDASAVLQETVAALGHDDYGI